MISVCIPVYNNTVVELVAALIAQIEKTQKSFEILLLDDASHEAYKASNQQITLCKGVRWLHAEKNSGRIEARKTLAAQARYDWLLFMDSDSLIIRDDYLQTYMQYLQEQLDVIVGGRVYAEKPPTECRKRLHWKYGTMREKTSQRFVFMTNNFCIRKKVFEQIYFPPTLQGYGHEDTWMGMQLKNKGVAISFIDNPVLHAGIEDASTFLHKSEEALKNIKALEQLVDKRVLKHFIKLYHYYALLKKYRLDRLIVYSEKVFHQTILKNLQSCQPSLKLFDFYRLAYFIRWKKQSGKDLLVKKD